jgi:hypothetical protein
MHLVPSWRGTDRPAWRKTSGTDRDRASSANRPASAAKHRKRRNGKRMKEPYSGDTERANRLYAARKAAGFKSNREAAMRFGWPPATYRARETANLYLDEATSNLYAKAFDVPSEWLIFGTGPGLPTAVLYGRAFAVEADWLLSGRLPSGLPAEAQASLNALLAMHYKSDGEAISAFRHLVRQERPAFTKEDRPGGEAPTSPERQFAGDKVPEYTPFALFRMLSGLPGGLPSSEWSFFSASSWAATFQRPS